ncbi:Type I inositol-1,4,5-trisphosphate 5-phosphatase [Papilio machaon]|uniref:Type I inositol-1,4,5-trisphosphate 5-phosphatase n=1 Tax=Papilio machaon TaxID=76193 RepID=A0A0N1IL44_PAPMA|nr:Type I inositol-1,4,5-trisphosphate 5-phosphatase [Papilio machaon]
MARKVFTKFYHFDSQPAQQSLLYEWVSSPGEMPRPYRRKASSGSNSAFSLMSGAGGLILIFFPVSHFSYMERMRRCKWSRKGFLRTRWLLRGTAVEFVNIHLFHDASNLVAMEPFPSVST